ncbi:redox-sensitive transcriptional activator SoxR [Amylibacter sp. IMCC11727]|uniref:redox-sensitive transcriptional activator SoxR n=1 Tax=Amylibacter sp. IMCC11727 TaxID=3039851 RepID=UPI00244E4F1B|nr:redox-sensitive transcriptional activator SoxR [Amylibacter sp. IMCC11727]WGI21438.1 redox-sensitive transcriptional activator SoxR [Amylibacter sp. IMCC11727]
MQSKIEKTISIGYLSERTGVAVSALRYYETQNLLHPERNAGGQRRFLRADIRRVSFILIAQQFGFTIDQIKTELDRLPAGRTPTKRDWSKIGTHFGKILDEKIETLQNMRNSLNSCIGCGCLSLKSCALYNPADKAATRGTGPRYLMGDKSGDI